MGSSISGLPEKQVSEPAVVAKPDVKQAIWTEEAAAAVQAAVDRVFGPTGDNLLDLDFSFTIADPDMDECPIIGCSKGFTELCGFSQDEVVGRNCRFLIDGVPEHLIDMAGRKCTRDFCEAVKSGRDYRRPSSSYKSWMPVGRPSDELVSSQVNARKDGSLFHNLFYLKKYSMSPELGETKNYIVALQSELADGESDLRRVVANLDMLDSNLRKVTSILGSSFYTSVAMTRQLQRTEAAPSTPVDDPWRVMEEEAFEGQAAEPWVEGRFTVVRQLAEAVRNKGVVLLMQESKSGKQYAVKKMPNSWMQDSHKDFLRKHPTEAELPWMDIGCARFLNSVKYEYVCDFRGLFRSDEHHYFMSEFAAGGDCFDLALQGIAPGREREAQFVSLVVEICTAIQQLHALHVVHRDLSLENVVQMTGKNGKTKIKFIDFGMSSSDRFFKNSVRGKPSYQAPEVHKKSEEYDAFLGDVFSAGVITFAILMKDYPWLSTKPDKDMGFNYVKTNGLQSYLSKKRFRDSNLTFLKTMSEPLVSLLEGMLDCEPSRRLTLGETQFPSRKSVWDMAWMKTSASF